MAFDEELVDRLRAHLRDTPDVSERKMFGGVAFMAGDSMFVGVNKDNLMARVGPHKHDAALSRPGARPMDFTGRPMKGFLFVGPEGYRSEASLRTWIDDCLTFVRSLPAKKPKAAKPKAAARGRRPVA